MQPDHLVETVCPGSRPSRYWQTVGVATLVILFWDGSIMYAESPPLTFDLPVIEAEVLDLDSNCERAILPLTGIRQIIVGDVGPAPPAAEMEDWDKAAFHFTDGQVLQAWVGPEATLGVHGGVWPVVEQGSDEARTLAIPYSSLTGVYRLRAFARRAADRGDDGRGGDAGVRQRVRGCPDLPCTTVVALGETERR